MAEYAELFKAEDRGEGEDLWFLEEFELEPRETIRATAWFYTLLEALNKLADNGWEVVEAYPSYRRSGPDEDERPERPR